MFINFESVSNYLSGVPGMSSAVLAPMASLFAYFLPQAPIDARPLQGRVERPDEELDQAMAASLKSYFEEEQPRQEANDRRLALSLSRGGTLNSLDASNDAEMNRALEESRLQHESEQASRQNVLARQSANRLSGRGASQLSDSDMSIALGQSLRERDQEILRQTNSARMFVGPNSGVQIRRAQVNQYDFNRGYGACTALASQWLKARSALGPTRPVELSKVLREGLVKYSNNVPDGGFINFDSYNRRLQSEDKYHRIEETMFEYEHNTVDLFNNTLRRAIEPRMAEYPQNKIGVILHHRDATIAVMYDPRDKSYWVFDSHGKGPGMQKAFEAKCRDLNSATRVLAEMYPSLEAPDKLPYQFKVVQAFSMPL